jgi:hypothetical protein
VEYLRSSRTGLLAAFAPDMLGRIEKALAAYDFSTALDLLKAGGRGDSPRSGSATGGSTF